MKSQNIYLEYTLSPEATRGCTVPQQERQSERREAGNQETGALRQEQSGPGVVAQGDGEGREEQGS